MHRDGLSLSAVMFDLAGLFLAIPGTAQAYNPREITWLKSTGLYPNTRVYKTPTISVSTSTIHNQSKKFIKAVRLPGDGRQPDTPLYYSPG
jgi:hypothetical protein